MTKFEEIKARYEKGYVTDTQLDRYAELGVITAEQVEEIKTGRSGGGGEYEEFYKMVTEGVGINE